GQGFARHDNVIETREMTIFVEDDARCIRVFDKARGVGLLKMCGEDLNQATKRLRIERQDMQNVYGVGNLFVDGKTADGDWTDRHWNGRNHGNFRFGFFVTDDGVGSDNFYGGGPSVSQFPIIYALGPKLPDGTFQNYGLFLDQVYRMSWDFHDSTNWYARTWGDQLRWFVMTGPNLKDLRGDFMELAGRPPVPPRHAFGLWISEFGYDNWNEVKEDLDSLKANRFPVDGVALDLQWFGGRFDSNEQDANCEPDRMGTLRFNLNNFPSPETEIRKFLNEYGVRFMTIEEPLIDNRLPEHSELWNRRFLARVSDVEPVTVTRDFRHEGGDNNCVWWGRGGLMDWTNPEAREFWHQQKRLNLALMGITSHWLDLGEPEMYYQDALYHGFPELGKNRHGDIHNVYNLFW
ncbi:MAG: TIM-barrel domain-containing protein, partial [Nitrospiraceae bacterium]